MKIFPLIKSSLFGIGLLSVSFSLADNTPSSIQPAAREGQAWWQSRYEQQANHLKNEPCQVLFLGDSITDAWSQGGKKVWDTILAPFQPANFGISGDQTSHLIYRLNPQNLESKTDPNLCIMMIGTNNTGHHQGKEASDQTALGITTAAIQLLNRFPKTHVIILGIFPRGNGPQDKLRLHNQEINAYLSKLSLPRTSFVDIGDQFLNDQGQLPKDISNDQLHLTEKGYEIWAKALLPYLQKYCQPIQK